MLARSPEHAIELLDTAFNEGDLESILRYYDDQAVLIQEPGTEARGKEQIRRLYAGILRPGNTVKQLTTKVLEADGVALFLSRWTANARERCLRPRLRPRCSADRRMEAGRR